jgi:hypothetical protein
MAEDHSKSIACLLTQNMKKWKLVALHIDQIRLKNVQSGHPT